MSKYELVPMPGLELNREDYKTNLQYRRNLARLTQKRLSEKSGVSRRMIEFYESKYKDINNAQAMTVYKLATALNCTVEDLLEK
jgi:transcriptional regulator with XRE-family HTH domain